MQATTEQRIEKHYGIDHECNQLMRAAERIRDERLRTVIISHAFAMQIAWLDWAERAGIDGDDPSFEACDCGKCRAFEAKLDHRAAMVPFGNQWIAEQQECNT